MFFTYFNQVMSPGVDINLTLSKTQSGELVVILLPKMNGLKDDAQHRLGPLRLSGTPQELDREFFPSITAPVQKTSGILMNLAEYEKQQAAAATPGGSIAIHTGVGPTAAGLRHVRPASETAC